jgi:DegV family protein with EDD domain
LQQRESRVAVVTDSTCDLSPAVLTALGITVVALKVRIGGQEYMDGTKLSQEEAIRLQSSHKEDVVTAEPTVSEFVKVYSNLANFTKTIFSLHISSKLSGTYAAALAAKQAVHTRCQIEVVDSQSASLGLGFLAMTAANAANEGASLREVTNIVRLLIPNIYIMFCVDTLDNLLKGGRISRAQAFVGNMLNMKPLLKVEEGEIHTLERVRTRAKALERLYEFVELFPTVERVGFVHSTSPEDVEALIKRVEVFVDPRKITVARYGPALGAHLGPGALGIVVDQGASSPF